MTTSDMDCVQALHQPHLPLFKQPSLTKCCNERALRWPRICRIPSIHMYITRIHHVKFNPRAALYSIDPITLASATTASRLGNW